MSNPLNFDRLSKATLSCLDSDDFMQMINKMILQKEELQSKISQKVMEVNTWVQVLQTSSVEEASELVSTLPETHTLSEEETELLMEYKNLSQMATAYSVVDFCSACTTDEGDTLLQFTSPFPCDSSSKFSVWLTTTEDNEYGIKYHNFPDSIPVSEILQKHIARGKGDVPKRFTTTVKQYLWPVFHRENQAIKFEKSDVVSEDNFVYHSTDYTLLSFTVPLIRNGLNVPCEFTLKFEILEILPYEVKTSFSSKDEPSAEIQDFVKAMSKEMKDKPFLEVVISELSNQKTASKEIDNTERNTSPPLFGAFN